MEYLVEPMDILPSPLCTCDNGATYSCGCYQAGKICLPDTCVGNQCSSLCSINTCITLSSCCGEGGRVTSVGVPPVI